MNNWSVYLLLGSDGKRTYIGASNDPEKRLRCHNGEISGGAKATQVCRPWKHVVIIEGLTKIQALQLEWRLKKIKSKKTGKLVPSKGILERTRNIYTVLNLKNWTSNSVDSDKVPLKIKWFMSEYCQINESLPMCMEQVKNNLL